MMAILDPKGEHRLDFRVTRNLNTIVIVPAMDAFRFISVREIIRVSAARGLCHLIREATKQEGRSDG